MTDAMVSVPNPYRFANAGSPHVPEMGRSYGNYSGSSGPRSAPPPVPAGDAGGPASIHPNAINQIPSYNPHQQQGQLPHPPKSGEESGPGGAGGPATEGMAAAAGEEGAAALGAGEAATGVEAAGLIGGLL